MDKESPYGCPPPDLGYIQLSLEDADKKFWGPRCISSPDTTSLYLHRTRMADGATSPVNNPGWNPRLSRSWPCTAWPELKATSLTGEPCSEPGANPTAAIGHRVKSWRALGLRPWRCCSRRSKANAMWPACKPLTGHIRSEEHTSELQSRENLVCRLL